MENLRRIRRHIRVIREVRHITRAMKLVAAAKLRSAQERAQAARPFARKISEVLADLASMMPDPPHPILKGRPVRHVGLVVIASDRGLCGRYNQDILDLAMQQAQQMGGPEKLVIMAMGRVARDFFRARGFNVRVAHVRLSRRPTFAWAERIANEIMDFYNQGVVDRVYLVYSQFVTTTRQEPRVFQLIPAVPPAMASGGSSLPASGPGASGLKLWKRAIEPSAEAVLNRLVDRYMQAVVYRALLEAEASERGARLTAMTAATDNATELIERLSTLYNRQRQAVITREISEVVAGAEAVH
ncbi:MAG TPA: ATP synthase F1 subunit gamma [Firmicutes bacterium]|nr:ATP synthase F1 subunit gamma [Bacillota bacterium]